MIKTVFKGDYANHFWKQIDRKGEKGSEEAITIDMKVWVPQNSEFWVI